MGYNENIRMETFDFSHLKGYKEDHSLYIKERYGSFLEACKSYRKVLQMNINEAIKKLHETDEPVRIKINMYEKYMVEEDCFERTFYCFEEIQYGPYTENHCIEDVPWENRNFKIWQILGIVQPFKDAQKQLAEKGYFLYDLTYDQSKYNEDVYEFALREYSKIYISIHKPTEKKFWHGLDVMPD